MNDIERQLKHLSKRIMALGEGIAEGDPIIKNRLKVCLNRLDDLEKKMSILDATIDNYAAVLAHAQNEIDIKLEEAQKMMAEIKTLTHKQRIENEPFEIDIEI